MQDACLEGKDSEVNVVKCDENDPYQQWQFNSYPFDEQMKADKL